MNIVKTIIKKSEGKELTKEEIKHFVSGFTSGKIKDYQASSMLMTIKLKGMTPEETFAYTEAMIESGEVYDLDEENLFDKHSTGGVGDKVSIALLPVLRAVGLRSLKMSGRGLGFTGGTIDKLESIPGFEIELEKEQALKLIKGNGIALTNSSDRIVPADKILYALRDVTGTVDSIPLIAGSIMSKKIASGSKYIFIDMKIGSGAFMPTIELATELGELMQKIGSHFGRKVFIGMTSMEQPLGIAIGNALEIKEAIEIIKGEGPKDAHNLIIKIASEILSEQQGISYDVAATKIEEVMKSGEALEAFGKWIDAQGGNSEDIISGNFIQPRNIVEVKSVKSGYVIYNDVKELGYSAIEVKAGRKVKTDELDYHSGIMALKAHGDFVEEGDALFEVHLQGELKDSLREKLLNAVNIIENKPEEDKLIIKEIRWNA